MIEMRVIYETEIKQQNRNDSHAVKRSHENKSHFIN